MPDNAAKITVSDSPVIVKLPGSGLRMTIDETVIVIRIGGGGEQTSTVVSWGDIIGKPVTYPPGPHTHTEYVKKIGDTMTGYLTINMNQYPGIRFSSGGVIKNFISTRDANQIAFAQYSLSEPGEYEYYVLPEVSEPMGEERAFRILTNKNPVTIAQGGTGAKTAEQARINLDAAKTDHIHDDRYYTESEMDKALAKRELLYYTGIAVNPASGGQVMRIPASGTDSRITTDTVVLSCTFDNPARILGGVSWQSYAGYVIFTGTCSTATNASVILGTNLN